MHQNILSGERLIVRHQCSCVFPRHSVTSGFLELTNFRLTFTTLHSVQNNQPLNISVYTPKFTQSRCILYVPLGTIQSLTSKQSHNSTKGFGISIVCKDLRSLNFVIADAASGSMFFETVKRYVFPNRYRMPLFAYIYGNECLSMKVFPTDGWDVYVPEEEYHRQNIFNNGWRISKVNEEYLLCDTYPALLAVPADVNDDLLIDCARHRNRGRIPVLSWLHPDSRASLTRCSQPNLGAQTGRSPADEELIGRIREANANALNLLVFDARSQLYAVTNKGKGCGIENPIHYSNVQYVFLKIPNIHTMRASQTKIFEACFPRPDDNKWLKALSESKWLKHIKCILFAATNTADKIENHKTSVLVHCSDGWDRTPQVCCLAMIMLDPYYRTIRGFEVLIEKEWLSFGHKFCQRTCGPADGGHLVFPGSEYLDDNFQPNATSSEERSPVFLQFIDCVWQITQQFPHSFEFNEHFLIFILDELYAARFGTFLFDSERESKANYAHKKTISIWSQVGSDSRTYQNPLYTPAEVSGHRVILPQNTMAQLRFWTRYYLRWDPSMRPQEPVALRDSELLDVMAHFRELNAVSREKRSISGFDAEPVLKNGNPKSGPQRKEMMTKFTSSSFSCTTTHL